MYNYKHLKGKKVVIKINDKIVKGKIKSGNSITLLKIGHLWWKKKLFLTQELINKIIKIDGKNITRSE